MKPELIKYWRQRHRLFSRFDQGIQLDDEGWYSVTPEAIATHVAQRFHKWTKGRPIVLLDAFCGCGGNAIAFARLPNVRVIATDVDREKLRRAAHNAAIYQVPPEKLLLVECNILFILEYCYKNGLYVLDQPIATPEQAEALMSQMPQPVESETVAGFAVGGIDLLPRQLDAVFMDPPWGGVDYEVLGKRGYDLQRNMKIARPNASVADDFFDSFQVQPRNKEERRAQFNNHVGDCVNGEELLALAAAATSQHMCMYDVPRNTSHGSIVQAALAAGYRGHVLLEEHAVNGRLKTVTAYMGVDWNEWNQP